MIRDVRFVVVAALSALVVAGVALAAQDPGPGGFRGHGPRGAGGPGVGFPLGQLELTEAQRQQIRQLTEQHRTAVGPLLEREGAAVVARQQAIEALPVDEGRIRAASEELAQVQAELAVQRARLQSGVYALLTPEQQQRARQLRAQREGRMKERQDRMRERMQQRQRQPA